MLDGILDELINNWNAKNYQPILEADAAGWLFHIMISAKDFYDPKEIHLETRVKDQSQVKPDIVIGKVDQNQEGKRICIDPKIVIEIKLFPSKGFTNSQHSVHFTEILERDLPKLLSISSENCMCYSLIIDGDGYLGKSGRGKEQTRLEELIEIRKKEYKNIGLYFIKYNKDGWSKEKPE
jgi:hypothetical protein